MKRLDLLLCAALFFAVPTWADPVITFFVGDTGTISYAGGNNPLVGSSIAIPSLDVLAGHPDTDGSYLLENGLLSFQTGGFATYDAGQGLLTFGADGSIKITGTVVTPGEDFTGTDDNPLLLGQFLGATFDLTANRFSLFLGNGPDVKYAPMVSYFLHSAEQPTWSFNAEIYGLHDVRRDYQSKGHFSTDVVDQFTVGKDTFYSQIVNTDAPAEVPEPNTMMLLGTVLIGVSVGLKKRAKAR